MDTPIIEETTLAIDQHGRELEQINKHRRYWLFASSVVYSGIIFLIFTWDYISQLQSKPLWWAIVSFMLILSINWWYWTMQVIRKFIGHRQRELNLILHIVRDIREIREDVKQLREVNHP